MRKEGEKRKEKQIGREKRIGNRVGSERRKREGERGADICGD